MTPSHVAIEKAVESAEATIEGQLCGLGCDRAQLGEALKEAERLRDALDNARRENRGAALHVDDLRSRLAQAEEALKLAGIFYDRVNGALRPDCYNWTEVERAFQDYSRALASTPPPSPSTTEEPREMSGWSAVHADVSDAEGVLSAAGRWLRVQPLDSVFRIEVQASVSAPGDTSHDTKRRSSGVPSSPEGT